MAPPFTFQSYSFSYPKHYHLTKSLLKTRPDYTLQFLYIHFFEVEPCIRHKIRRVLCAAFAFVCNYHQLTY